jgi:FkbM family methyltransferase
VIVVDVGCATQGPEHSTDVLIDRFHPNVYFGFDPEPTLVERTERVQNGVTPDAAEEATVAVFRRAAAWTHVGVIEYEPSGITGTVVASMMGDDPVTASTVEVPCFDLAAFLAALPSDGLVVKMDCEGAEYTLVPALIAANQDLRISTLMVEWHHEWEGQHPDLYGSAELTEVIRCPVEPWG